MTVQKDVTKNIYVGNGSTRTFPFTFECPAEHPEYIKVYLMQDDGTALATSDYQLDMDARQITYPSSGTALPEGKKLVIMRELPLQQMMNLVNNGPYFAEDIETAFDECVMMLQQQGEKIGRVLMIAVDADMDNFNRQIPLLPGRSFRVNDAGNGFVAMENPESVLAENKATLEASKAARDEAKRAMTAATTAATNANVSAANAADSAELAQNSATDAARMADKAAGYVSNVTVWDNTTEYKPPDVVMTSDGSTYRCIKANANTPPQSSADCWAITTSVAAETFEYDEKGDLMPLILPRTSNVWEAINGEITPIAL